MRSLSPMAFDDTAPTSFWPSVSRLVTPVRTSAATSVSLSLFCSPAFAVSKPLTADWVSPPDE